MGIVVKIHVPIQYLAMSCCLWQPSATPETKGPHNCNLMYKSIYKVKYTYIHSWEKRGMTCCVGNMWFVYEYILIRLYITVDE